MLVGYSHSELDKAPISPERSEGTFFVQTTGRDEHPLADIGYLLVQGIREGFMMVERRRYEDPAGDDHGATLGAVALPPTGRSVQH